MNKHWSAKLGLWMSAVALVAGANAVQAADTRVSTGGEIFIDVDTASLAANDLTFVSSTNTATPPSGFEVGVSFSVGSDLAFGVDDAGNFSGVTGGKLEGVGSDITLERTIPGTTLSLEVTIDDLGLVFTDGVWIIEGFSPTLGQIIPLFELAAIDGSTPIASYDEVSELLNLEFDVFLSDIALSLIGASGNVLAGSGFATVESVSTVPEPSPLAALMLGGAAVVTMRSRRMGHVMSQVRAKLGV